MDLINVVTVLRNEAVLLPYFLRWYGSVAERIVVYDGGSDDGSIEILKAHPKVELRRWELGDELDDINFKRFANEEYKKFRGRCHWLIFPDADELIHHIDLRGLLMSYHRKGITLPGVTGYSMIDNRMPTTNGQIFEELKFGVRDTVYDKLITVNPMMDFEWSEGKHLLTNKGWSVSPESVGWPARELKLLHYRFFNREYVQSRKKRNFSRASERNKANAFGHTDFPNYTSGTFSMEWYDRMMDQRFNVLDQVTHDSVDGWFDYQWFFEMFIAEANPIAQCVEVGSWMGASAIYMGRKIIESGKHITLHCVDSFEGTCGDPTHQKRIDALQEDLFTAFSRNIRDAGVSSVINTIRSRSVEASTWFTDRSLDLVFLDGDHSYESVKNDIAHWIKKVKPGGLLAGHDFSEQLFPGVVKAVLSMKNNEKRGLRIQNGVWWLRRG